MNNLYDKEDILTYKTDEIPLDSTVIIKTKYDAYKGKLILNNEDCIAIDYPKELNGTYLARDGIESIRVLGSFSDLINLITKKDGDKMLKKESGYLCEDIGIRKDYLYKITIDEVGVITGEIINFNGCTYVIKSYKNGEFNHYIVKYKNILDLHPFMTIEQYNKKVLKL